NGNGRLRKPCVPRSVEFNVRRHGCAPSTSIEFQQRMTIENVGEPSDAVRTRSVLAQALKRAANFQPVVQCFDEKARGEITGLGVVDLPQWSDHGAHTSPGQSSRETRQLAQALTPGSTLASIDKD